MTHRSTAAVSTFAVAILLALASTGVAHAGVAGSVTLTSDYLFRGISQNNQEPALQAGLEYAADTGAAISGVYVGTWGSTISWLSDLTAFGIPVSNSLELDVYGGYRGKLSAKVAYDVGALYYWYPGDYPSGFTSPDTGELHAGITFGPFAGTTFGAKYSHALTDLFGCADSDGSGHLDLNANWEFVPTWTLNVHGGKQWVENNASAEYADWKIGATKGFANGFSAALAYADTDADEPFYSNAYGNFLGEDAVVLTVTKTF
ncbi:MAG TPA: TorF family putative porin [Lysobacter sp.]|nr:TorF family putative porin [Lysobacter sp.]